MPCDMILSGGVVVDVVKKTAYSSDIGIKNGLISEIGPHLRGDRNTKVVDVRGKYVSPGFIESHMHFESGKIAPLEFAYNAAKHGTTAAFTDPHEIANVHGVKGMNLFLELAQDMPLDSYIGFCSCVPSTGFVTSGATIGVDHMKNFYGNPMVYGLSEMMNFPGIIYGLGDARQKVDLTFRYNRDPNKRLMIEGHYPGGKGKALRLYVRNGNPDGKIMITSDHESTSYEEAIEKKRAGMTVFIREGTICQDLDSILSGLVQNQDSLEGFTFCADDMDAVELYRNGHLDRIAKKAIPILQRSGMSYEEALIQAIVFMTHNPGEYFKPFLNLYNHPPIGQIKKGFKANIAVFDKGLTIDKVFHNGKLVVDKGENIGKPPKYDYSEFMGSMNINKKFEAEDFKMPYHGDASKVNVRVIGALDGRKGAETESLISTFSIMHNELVPNPWEDIAKIAVIERYTGKAGYSIAYLKNLGIKKGAIATSINHDAHNIIVVGADDASMAKAVNCINGIGGGIAVVYDDRVESFPLEISGLMSTKPIEEAVKELSKIRDVSRNTGTSFKNPFMTLGFLGLEVIPNLKITDTGLYECDAQGIRKVELIEREIR